ncbi:MAG TPA: HAMP domain-containing sensor histidine kinase [Candidatus Dormibacteraeota bacterium]|nr:HAMP domain-containing sensor histidine kinase [Candidatus Dormibacteraeota bacterium]
MTPTLSLRLRMTLLWCTVSLVLLLGLELLSLAVLSAQLDGAVDNDLTLVAGQYQARVAGATSLADLRQRAETFLADDVDAGHGFAAVYRIQLDDGTVLSNNGDRELLATMSAARPPSGAPATVRDPDLGDLRVAAIPIVQDGRQVGDFRIALPLSGVQASAADHLTPLLIGNAVLIVLGGLLAYAVTGHALAPVRRITSTAASISEGDLSRRIDYHGPRDEVGRLAETFDAMLGRLQHGFEQRQAFYALASHELRTPLTIVRGHLEVLRRSERPAPEDIRETLDVSLEEIDRITDEINDMLLLGRMLLGQAFPLTVVDAGAVLTDVHRKARRLAVRDWQLDVAGPAPVRADSEQLSRALLNLVTNAVRHTTEGDRVRLTCRAEDEWTVLEVADAGHGIRAADLPHVFDPWYRAGKRDGRVGGLGLMIVREVAAAHGGQVDVASREGQGTTFRIRLRAAGPEPAGAGAGTADEPRRDLALPAPADQPSA